MKFFIGPNPESHIVFSIYETLISFNLEYFLSPLSFMILLSLSDESELFYIIVLDFVLSNISL